MADDDLTRQAQRILDSGILGRGRLLALFEFLRDSTLAGRVPKELEVAHGAFGKEAAFDVAQDALVRVYVHKLRRKLTEYQHGPGAGDPVQLVVPRGEYRLALEPGLPAPVETAPPAAAATAASPAGEDDGARPVEMPPADSPPASGAPSLLSRLAQHSWWVLAASLAVNVLLIGLAMHGREPPDPGLAVVRRSPFWAPLLVGNRPIVVLLGDYYIFGETDPNGMEVQRLIRDFAVDSPSQLSEYLQTNPGKIGTYEDIGLTYLPTSAAHVLRDVLPLLLATHRPVRIALVSELSPQMLKSADIVYVGLVSGLGMLRDVVFAGSRLAVGESYDELVDARSGTHYYSGEELHIPGHEKYHDFGYFASFPGPAGNHLLVISGMRDTGLTHTGETVTSAAGVQQLAAQIARDASGCEALYEVYGLAGSSVGAKLVLAGPLAVGRLWSN